MVGYLFTLGLTYGGAFASLFNPFIGLLVYVAFAILRPRSLWFWSVPDGNYSRIVAIGLLVGWMIHGFGKWQFGKAKLIVGILASLVVWSVFSAAFIATNKDLAWNFVEIFVKIALPFLVGITTIDSLKRVKQLAWVILLCEGFLALQFNQWYLEGYNRLWMEGFGDMDNNCNAIALVTCIGLGLLLGQASPRLWQKLIAYGFVALMGHAVLISFSRGGMLALIIMGVIAFLLIPKRIYHYMAVVLVLALVIRFAGPEVSARFTTAFADTDQRDASATSRLELWKACLTTMVRHPLGVGPANWGEVVEEFGFPRGKLAHSLWMQTGAELGIVGLVLLLLFYGVCVWRLLPLCREKTPIANPWIRHLARGVVASLCGFTIAVQFVSLDLLEHPYYVTLIGAGVLKLVWGRVPAPLTQKQLASSEGIDMPRLHEPRHSSAAVTHFGQDETKPLSSPDLSMQSAPVIYSPVLFISVKTPPSKVFVIKAHHPILGEYDLPLDTASWTVINKEGEAEVKDGKLIGKRPGQVILKATLTFGDGSTKETPEMTVEVKHLVPETVWIELRGSSS